VNNRFRASHSVYTSWELRTAVRRRSCLVYNSGRLTPSRRGGHTFLFETRISPVEGTSGRGSEWGNRISDANFLRTFRSSLTVLCLVFYGTDNGWRTDDCSGCMPCGPTIITALCAYLMHLLSLAYRTSYRSSDEDDMLSSDTYDDYVQILQHTKALHLAVLLRQGTLPGCITAKIPW